MAGFEGFSGEDLARWEAIAKIQERASSSLSGYLETVKSIRELEENLRSIQKTKLKIDKRLTDLGELKLQLEQDTNYLNNANYALLLKEIAIEEKNLKIANKNLKVGKENVKILAQQLNQTNLLVASTKTLMSGAVVLGKHLKNNLGYWLEQQKGVKKAELSMGILSKQSSAFRDNIYKASLTTNALGVDSKTLAQIQGTYSEQVGRTVVLSEQGLIAMAELAEGTVLGSEGAAELAANMENFNISATKSADLVENMLNDAHKMGVNGAKATRELEKNIKMANKYHFKDGIKSLGKMVLLSSRFKLEMDQIAGFADKVFDIEGAVEMGAQLQVLGGGWAKLGDPFQLMFKARNDMEGFTKDIIKATDITGQFNSETGEFEITALELSRLREVSKATGMDFNMLSESAKEMAKSVQIKGKVTGFFTPEEKDFIASIAKYDEKSKTYMIRVDGSEIPIDKLADLKKNQIKLMMTEKASLDKRAKDAQTFDETWKNIVNMLKSSFLPGFESFAGAMSSSLTGFQDWLKNSGAIEGMVTLGKYLGEFTAGIIRFTAENPKTALALAATAIIAKESSWFLRGMILGKGFNSVANAGGGSDILDTIGGKGKGGKFGALRKASKIGKFAKGIGGASAGLLSAGISGYSEWNENSEAGMGNGENSARTGIRAGLSGGGAWAGAAGGAAIGTMIFPGVGTAIGALVGGIAGGMAGDKVGDMSGDMIFDNVRTQQDFISRPGASPIPFSSADTLVGLKKDGGLGKALINGGTDNNGGKMQISFTNPIRLEGNLTVSSADGSSKLDLNNPMFIRSLTEMIQREISRSISGGKISSNPVN